MPGITIRKARISDAPRLADIAYRAWESGILPILIERDGMRERERRRLVRAVGEAWRYAIVAEIDDMVVGWCSRQRGRNYIPYLFVMPEIQGHGIGTLLLERMEIMLELEGAAHIHLETPADHVRAVHFYEKQGYRILALKPNGRSGHDPFASVHLEKRLQPYSGIVDEH
ncbi:GNAT family N-acetyltransferase [Devosia sp. YIM 151766]|uniref:GNAT family N-acetyltransferase n=1 Tax=Devosia sp. YIM 151766 TaxID=3017325 RepID=UPI00255CA767|nr:GNAT family N-acetyltransferase [Devosia sp. YIM 151766]WIY54376.1 GNAT family N-acetyltransferase [Devosia sp. YIM 151766]